MDYEIKRLVQLVEDLNRSTTIPIGRTKEYKLLRDFFETLFKESEYNYYSSFTSGKPSEYTYTL